MDDKNMSFEKAMERLEEICENLSRDGVSLENALELYEEGIKIAKICNGRLDESERKIKMLRLSDDGEVAEIDFPTTDSNQHEENNEI